jgi:hypothetical protein
MRRIVTGVVLALAATLAPVHVAAADDPDPGVVLGPPPWVGVDAMIRADGASAYVGRAERGSGLIEQDVAPLERAVSYVRVCNHNVRGSIRVDGTSGGRAFRARYLVGRHDVTRSVVAGTYRTQRLGSNECAHRIRLVVRLRSGESDRARTFLVKAVGASGARDTVGTRVNVVGRTFVP